MHGSSVLVDSSVPLLDVLLPSSHLPSIPHTPSLHLHHQTPNTLNPPCGSHPDPFPATLRSCSLIAANCGSRDTLSPEATSPQTPPCPRHVNRTSLPVGSYRIEVIVRRGTVRGSLPRPDSHVSNVTVRSLDLYHRQRKITNPQGAEKSQDSPPVEVDSGLIPDRPGFSWVVNRERHCGLIPCSSLRLTDQACRTGELRLTSWQFLPNLDAA